MVLAEKMKRLPLEDVERFMNNTPVLIDVEGCMIKGGPRERDFIMKSYNEIKMEWILKTCLKKH